MHRTRGLNPKSGSLVLAASLLVAANCGEKAAPPAKPHQKNIILITIDTLRADHLSAYGYARATSPRLDAFAKEAVLFERCWSQWPQTSPSFASMMTGLYPHSNGVIRGCYLKIAEEYTLLAERLHNAGYATVGATSNPTLGGAQGFMQGFDRFYESWKLASPASMKSVPGLDAQGKKVTALALDGVDAAAGDHPLFLWAHYMDPHGPYEPPAPCKDMFMNDALFDGSVTAPFLTENGMGGIPTHARIGDEKRVAYYVALYDAEVFAVDQQVGALLDGLASRGLLEDALVIFTADHGEHLGDHGGYFTHGAVAYEDCAHVPFIMKIPGVAAGTRFDAPVGLIDMVPTILDWIGLEPDLGLEGTSLLPVLHNETAPARYVYLGAGHALEYQRAIRMGKWKLIYVPDSKDRKLMNGTEYELYDLDADPGEKKNVIDDPKNRQVVDVLERRLQIWIDNGKAKGIEQADTVELTDDVGGLAEMRRLGYVR